MDSHDLSSFGSDLRAYISEAITTWYVHHQFSDCRCDTVCIDSGTMTTFSQGDGTKIKSNMTQSVYIYKLSTMDLYHLI